MSAPDADLFRRALARCIVAVIHREPGEDAPCSGCLLTAARQLAIHPSSALASIAPGGSAATGAVDGAAGRAVRPPTSGLAGGSTLKSNRPPALNEGPAESGPVRPQ